MRRRKAFLGLAVILVVGVPASWFLSRRDIPAEFLGKRPPAQFVFLDEFEGKPWIDFRMPGFGRVMYPKKRKLALSKPETRGLCGVLEWDGPLGVTFGGETKEVPASFAGGTNGAIRHLVRPRTFMYDVTGVMIALPFATAEKYRSATLRVAGDSYDMRLPLSPRHGPSPYPDVSAVFGAYTMTARAKPWKLTTAPMQYEIRISGPSNALFLCKVRHVFGVGYSSESMLVVEPGRQVPLSIDFLHRKAIDGNIIELKAEPIKLRARKNGSEMRLHLLTGEIIHGTGKRAIRELGFRLFRVGNRIWPRDTPDLTKVKDGDIINAEIYREAQTWTGSIDLKGPPAGFISPTMMSDPVNIYWEVP